MKRHLLFYACLLAAVTATAASRTATEAYVTNRVTQATNALHEAIAPTIDYSTNNTTLVETIAAKAPAPDFTTNNVVLTNTIAQVAPAPGNYEVVSNRAMQISMPGDEEHPGGLLFIPYFDGRAKEAHDAYDLIHSRQSRDPGQLTLKQRGQEDSGGAVWGVWWPAFLDAWSVWHWVASEDYVDAATNAIPRNFLPLTGGTMTGDLGISSGINFFYGEYDGPRIYPFTPGALAFCSRYSEYSNRYAILDLERLPENTAAEIAFLPEVATPETVTNIVRDISLGGIWDAELEVWWTPVMSNGALTYQATTNVNLNAEN